MTEAKYKRAWRYAVAKWTTTFAICKTVNLVVTNTTRLVGGDAQREWEKLVTWSQRAEVETRDCLYIAQLAVIILRANPYSVLLQASNASCIAFSMRSSVWSDHPPGFISKPAGSLADLGIEHPYRIPQLISGSLAVQSLASNHPPGSIHEHTAVGWEAAFLGAGASVS